MRTPSRLSRKSPRRSKLARWRKAPKLILSSAAALLLPQIVNAALLSWDTDNNPTNGYGGSGTWNTSAGNLVWDDNGAAPNVAWTNDYVFGNIADFKGTGGTVTLGEDIAVSQMIFETTGYSIATANSAITLTFAGAGAGVNIIPASTITLGMQIAGTDGLLKTGNGTLRLTNNNSQFTGAVVINGGVVEVSSLPNLGLASGMGRGEDTLLPDQSFSAFTLDGGTLRYVGTGDSTNRIFTLASGGGTIDSSGTGGSLGFSRTSAGIFFGASVGPRTLTLTGTNTGLNNIATAIGDADVNSITSVVKSGTGTWVANGSNTYTGKTTLSGGVLIANTMTNGNSPSSLGAASSAAANVVFDGGNLRYIGAAASTDRSFTVTSNGGTITSLGTGALTFSDPGFAAASGTGNRTLTLDGSVAGNIMRNAINDPTNLYVLDQNNSIKVVDPSNPGAFVNSINVTSVVAGETLQAIDFRPSVTANQLANGLYAVGTNGANGHVYRIDLSGGGSTATATQVATLSGLTGAIYGFDINPVTDTARIVNDTDQSFSVNLNTNAVTAGTALTFAVGDVNDGTNPAINGIAFSNPVPGATSTTLYGIDVTKKGFLVTINEANGVMATVNKTSVGGNTYDAVNRVGLDISAAGYGFAALNNGTSTELFGLNLSNAGIASLGFLGTGANGTTTLRDLALSPDGLNGTTSLLKTGLGSWTLDRAGSYLGNTYTGSTTINQGTLTLNFNQTITPDANIIHPKSTLVMGGGTLAIIGKTSLPNAKPLFTGPFDNVQTFNGLTVNQGASLFTATPGAAASPLAGGTVTVNLGAITRNTGGTVGFGSTGSTSYTTTRANTNGILGPWATFGGNDWASANGSGPTFTVGVPAGGAYTATTATSLGGATANANITGGITTTTLSANTTVSTIRSNLVQGTTISIGSGLKLTASGILLGGSNGSTALTISGGTLSSPAGGELIVFSNTSSTATATGASTNATVANSTTLNLTGLTNVSVGAIVTGPNIPLGTIVLALGANSVTLSNPASTTANGGSFTFTSNLNLGSTITDNGGTTSVTYSGTGITTVSGSNTYTGGTLLNSGALHIANPLALGSGTLTIGRGTTFPILASDGANPRDIANPIVMNGDLQLGDTFGSTGTGQVTLTGSVNLNGGNRSFTSGNGYNAISGVISNGTLTKAGTNTLALLNPANTYAGGTYVLAGNLDVDAVGALGTGPVYLQGGVLSASNGLATPLTNLIYVVTNSTIGRAGVFDGLDLAGIIDLGNAPFNAPRALTVSGPQLRISGNITNGAFSKAGLSDLFISGSQSTYVDGTYLSNGSLRLNGDGRLGADVFFNDIVVNPTGTNLNAILRVEKPSNIGSKQGVKLDNVSQFFPNGVATTNTSVPVLGLGAGFANTFGLVDFVNSNNAFFLTDTGIGKVRINNNPSGQPPAPIGIALDGIQFGDDVVARATAQTDAPVWLGATTLNGIYTGGAIVPDTSFGGDTTVRLGVGGGTLTIAGANVLSGQRNVVIGSYDNTLRGMNGVVYLPQPQDFGGAGNTLTVGAGGMLVVGQNASLGDSTNTISMAAGTLNLRTTGTHGFGVVDTQYAARNINLDFSGSLITLDPLGGGQQGAVQIGQLTFSSVNLNQTLTLATGQNFDLRVNGINFPTGVANNTTVNVNSGFVTVTGQLAGDNNTQLIKGGGATLILNAASAFNGTLTLNAGVTVFTSPAVTQGQVNLGGSTLSLRSDVAGTQTYTFAYRGVTTNPVSAGFALTGGGTIYVGPNAANGVGGYAATRIQVPGLYNATQTGLTVNGELNYSLGMTGPLQLGVPDGVSSALTTFTLAVNSARVELMSGIQGNIQTITPVGGGAVTYFLPDFAKTGIGSLTLSGAYNAVQPTVPPTPLPAAPTPATIITQGTIIANHDTAGVVDVFGGGSLLLGTSSSNGLLLSGARTLTKNINFVVPPVTVPITTTSGNQVIGGLDGGAKVYAGDIALNTATGTATTYLTAEVGGDVTFTGTISGGLNTLNIGSSTGSVLTSASGSAALGLGKVILAPGSDSGNTFNIPIALNNGTLVGQAQATGSPFGDGSATNLLSVTNGTLQLNGRASGASTTSTAGSLTVAGGAKVVIADLADAGTTTLNFGSLVRSGTGTLTYLPVNGTGEEVLSFTTAPAAPAVVNGILAPWAVKTAGAGSGAGDFVRVGAGNSLVPANYTSAAFDAVTANQVVSTTNGGPLTGNRAAYAIKAGSSLDLGGKTLSLGDTATLNAFSAGGLILNGGANVTNGVLNFGNAEGIIYVDPAAPSTISAAITSGFMNETRAATLTASSTTITGLASTARLYVGMPVSTGGFITSVSPTSVTVSSALANPAPSSVTFTGVTSLTKTGAGILTLAASNAYRGGTSINEGTLRMGAVNAIGRFTNAGAVGASLVTIASGATLDLNGFATEIGNLQGAFGATVNLGASRLTIGRSGTNTTFSGQLLGGSSGTLQKVGGGTLTLDNTRADSFASSFNGSVLVDQGALTLVVADQSNGSPFAVGNSLPIGTTITLRGGTLNLRSSGDNGGAQQNLVAGYNIVLSGGPGTLSTDRFGGAESNKMLELNNLTLNRNDFGVNNANNVFAKFVGLTVLTDNARINNGSELGLDGVITDGGLGLTLNKAGGGNLFINSVSNYTGGTVISGGTLIFGTRGVDQVRLPGLNVMANDFARAGTGPIVLETNTAISLNDATNLAPGQTVRNYSSPAGSASSVTIRTDRPLADYNLRTSDRGALILAVAGSNNTITNGGNSTVSYGQGGVFSQTLDMLRIGNGQWGLSANATLAGGGGDTIYTSPTLGVGTGNVYRFYGSSGATLILQEPNVLTGNASVEVGKNTIDLGNATPGQSNALIRLTQSQDYTGNTLIHRSGTNANVNARLEIRSTVASQVIENYGQLFLTGNGRLTNDNGTQTKTVSLRPGSALRLDYASNLTGFLVPTGQGGSGSNAGSFLDKWGDSAPLILDGAQLELINAVATQYNGATNATTTTAYQTVETIGALTIKGGAEISLNRTNVANSVPVLMLNGPLTRSNLATLAIRPQNAGTAVNELGVSGGPGASTGSRLMFVNDADIPVRGTVASGAANGTKISMVSPMFFDIGLNQFVDYDPTESSTGFKQVPFLSRNNATFNSGGLNNGTEIIDINTTAVTTTNAGADVWALRASQNIAGSNPITIRSGGLVGITNTITISNALNFVNGATTQEADIWNTSQVTLGGAITANNMTKNGPGRLILAGTNTALAGSIQVNGGILQLNAPATLRGTTATDIRLHASYANNSATGNAGIPQIDLRSTGAGANYAANIIISEFVPYANFVVADTSASGGAQTLTLGVTSPSAIGGNFTIEGGGSDGTVVAFSNANSYVLAIAGTTTLGLPGNAARIGFNVGNTVTLSGKTTGPAPLVKSGASTLNLANSASVTNDFSGGLVINDGVLELRYTTGVNTGTTTNVQAAGTGAIEINRGTLRVLGDLAANQTTATINVASLASNNLTVRGPSTLTFDRISTGTPTLLIGGDSSTFKTEGSPTIQINSSGSTGGGVWAGKTVVNDSPTFNLVGTSFTLGNTTGGDSISGAGHIYKTGAQTLIFSSGAANTFSGGLDITQGIVRAATNTDTFGTGPIRISPTGILSVQATSNVASASQVANLHSSSTAMAGLSLRAAGLDPLSFLNAANITSAGNGGLLALDANYSTAVNLSIFDGYWYLGTTAGSTFSSTSLTVGAENTYRIGGGGGNLTISGTNALINGASANKAIFGKPNALLGTGTVTLSARQSYSGGATISRTRDNNNNFGVASVVASTEGSNTGGPLGIGSVEVYGNLTFQGNSGGAVNATTGAANRNSYSFHPGSRLVFSQIVNGANLNYNTTTKGRWFDSTAIALRSSSIELLGSTAATTDTTSTGGSGNVEIVGAVSFSGGSELRVLRGAATGTEVQLNIGAAGALSPTLTRVGAGTLTLNHTATALGTTVNANSGAEVITVSNTTGLIDANMVKPYIVSRTEGQFLVYNATQGFQVASASNLLDYVPTTNTALSTGVSSKLGDGTGVLSYDSASTATLGSNLDVWALRTQGSINSAADASATQITIRSGGLTEATNAVTINANLAFLAPSTNAPIEALIHASANTLTINGQITASAITKFGTNTLVIQQDQPGFSGPWNLNQGTLTIATPGGLGTGPVFLNGWTGSNATQTQTNLNLTFNSGSPDEMVYTSGKITSLDMNLITMNTGANDRNARIGDIDATTTSGTAGLTIPGMLRFIVNNSRNLLRTGTVTLGDDYVIQVDAQAFGPGSTNGVQIGNVGQNGALVNQGTYNLTKIGDGQLVLGDNSTSFTGAKSITVNEGSVKVLSNGSLGGAGTTAVIDNGGALEIAKANYVPTGNLVEKSGAIERWSVNGARTGTVTMGAGVHLQVQANQTNTTTINLNGGSIMGYVPLDVDENVIFYTLGSNVSVNVQSDSSLGQPYPAGTNAFTGNQNHLYYDMGKQNQLNNPLNPQLNGAVLDIRGNITSASSSTLTKVGLDVIQLSGNNSGFNTNIREGVIQLGSSTALPSNKNLTLSSTGALDLNGFNATVGGLAGTAPQSSIVNSALSNNTFTVNTTATSTYDGVMAGNLSFVKRGTGTLTLAGANVHTGRTDALNGTLKITGSIANSSVINVAGGATLDVSGVSGGFLLGGKQTLAGGTGASKGIVTGATTLGSGSTISPGDAGATGILSFASGVNFNPNIHFKLEIASLSGGAGLGYDQVEVTGNVTIAGDFLGSGVLLEGGISQGDVFYIVNNTSNGTTTGSLAGLAENQYLFIGGVPFQISYMSDATQDQGGFGVGGNDIALRAADVPEPGSIAILAAGLGTLLGLQRFRRRRQG